jgi:hypothetical protein
MTGRAYDKPWRWFEAAIAAGAFIFVCWIVAGGK